MSFILTDETTADILIFWIGSSDGSMSYWEDEAIKEALSEMEYTLSTYRDTVVHLGALSTEDLKQLVKDAREYAKTQYSAEQKKDLLNLINTISSSTKSGNVELDKLQTLQEELAAN